MITLCQKLMRPRRLVSKSHADAPQRPFATAEEAWFWFIRCQFLRRAGARLSKGSASHERPCEPDDIYRAVAALARKGLLHRPHLSTLATFGQAGRPPDGRCPEEQRAVGWWREAMEGLGQVLREKGIMQ